MSGPLPSPQVLREKEFLVACLCADWCDTCRQYQTPFNALAAAFPRAAFAWVDVEDEAERVDDFEVENFPTLLVQRGELVLFYGTLPPYIAQAERLLHELFAQTPDEARTHAFATPERRQWQTDRNLRSLLIHD